MTCETDKAAALEAYKKVLLGQQVSEVTFGDHTTKFAVSVSVEARLKALRDYVAALPCATDEDLALVGLGGTRTRRAARLFYGC